MKISALRRLEARAAGRVRVTMRLDVALAEQALQDVAAHRAESLNDWLNEAARAKVRSDALTLLITDLLENTGGPLSEQEVSLAREHLATGEIW